jgi:hypothetical protein
MSWDAALGSVIEVAVGIAGFSGIAAAVGRRREGRWDPMEQLLLRVLLLASGIAILFSFLPFTMIELMEPRLVWRILSGLLAAWVLGIAIIRTRQGFQLGAARKVGLGNPFLLIGALLVFSVLAANALWFGAWSLYVIGVLWQVTIAFIAFVYLLLSALDYPLESDSETD